MCDCFHLVLPNWPGSPASGSGRQLRPAEPPGDTDADAEDEDSVNEVAVEDIRPRPQGSSPVYEYSIEEEYLKLQEENKKSSTDKSKESHPQETMEVTLKTEVEAGASGFSVMGGGNEGIFIKKVLKESPASKIFSLREGDQLLSATIFFDNIKYEDALKILQYSEPYRVQFSLKRKIAGKEDLEHIHSTAQYKKERISQEKEFSESIPEETLHVSGKAISEEDRETLIVSQRVGRSKRPKKDRLSWPKFQSIKNKKILGHRRSHSTSDAYEPAIQDISPTSTDTESQFQQEVHIKEKKGSQKKLKFPSIGFKMHRSKPETQDKQKKEIKTTLLSEREKIHKEDISLENPEILTVEYTTSPAYEIKTGEVHEVLTKDLKEMTNGISSHAKKCPEVEISIKKEKDKETTSKFTVPEVSAITTQISKPSLETPDLKESPTKQTQKASSKSRKKKQKGTADRTEEESGNNIDMTGHTAQGSVQVKGLEIGTAKAELHAISDTMETGEKQVERDTQILTIQKTKFGISKPKRKEPVTENTELIIDIPHSVPETTADTSSEDSRNLEMKAHVPDTESEVSTWKIQMPSFKITKTPKAGMKMPTEERTVESVDTVKKAQAEEDSIPISDKTLKMDIGMKTGEKDIEGKESKFRLPKFKLPTFTWATTKDETGQTESQVSDKEEKAPSLEVDAKREPRVSTEETNIPNAEIETGIAKEDARDKDIIQQMEVQLPSLKTLTVKNSSMENQMENIEGKTQINKKPIEIKNAELEIKSLKREEMSEMLMATGEGPTLGLKVDAPGASLKMPKADIKAPKVDISLPSVDVTLPKASVDLQATEASLALEGEAKGPEKEAAKTKDGKFKMPKFGMPSFGWSSSKEAKATVAAEVDVGLTEPQVTVPSGTAKVDMTLPAAELQAPGVEVTMETTAATDGEKGRFKMPDITMPDVKMPSVKLPKVKAPHVQVSLPKAEVSLPKVQAEVQEGKVALQGPDAEGDLEVASGKVEGGGMKIHMPKVKVPSVAFSKPTVKTPKLDADASLPEAELKAGDISIAAPDIKLPSVKGSLELQAPQIDLKAPSAEGSLDGAELEAPSLKGKFKMPKFDKPKFGVSPPKAEGLAGEVSLPTAEVDLPSATVTATGEGPSLGLKVDAPGASLKMPKADIKAPKVDISLPSVDVTLSKDSVDLQAPKASLALEGEAKAPEKEAAKTKDGKFKMPKFGMPSFGWSSSKEAKATVAADVDVGLTEPQVTVPSGTAKVDMTLPEAEIQAPGVEVTMETTAATDGEKGRFKMPDITMPDVKMPSVKLPKVKAPHVQVSLPEAEVSLPKVQAEVQEGKVALQGPDAEGGLEVASGKVEGGGMKIHMPKVKVPSVVFSKPTVKTPKLDADASLPEAELKAGDISIAAPDIKLPSVEGSLDGAELEAPSLKGKFKMPKFDKPKFGVSLPKAEGLAGEVSLPTAEVDLPSATVTATGEGPTLGLKVDAPGAFLKMPKADIKAPKVDISLPSVDVTLPKASVDLQAPEASLALEGEAKGPEKEAAKTKDGKFKMPKFGMPSFGWSSSKEAKATVAADVDVGLTEPQVTVPSGTAKVDMTLPEAEIQAPGMEVTMETTAATDGEKGRFKMPDVKMPSVKLPKVKAPHVQVSLTKAEVSLPKVQAEVQEGKVALQGPNAEGGLEVASGKVEGGGMKIHMPKVKVPSVAFSKPTIKTPKLDADASLPEAELKAGDISIAAPDIKLPSVEGSLELQAPQIDLKAPSAEGSLDGAELEAPSLKGKFKMPKFDKPKFGVSPPKAEGLAGEVSLPTAEVDLPSATVTATGEGPSLGLKVDAPGASLKMPKADIKAPKVDISLPSVDVTLPKASVDLQAPEASLALEGESKGPEKEAAKTKDGKFKMPKFGMPSFGWSSSKEAKATVAADVDVGLTEPQVTVPSGTAKVDMTLPEAEIQAPGMEVTMETTAATDGEKGRFKMPDVKMPSVKLPKVKAPHVQVSLTKAEVSLPKVQAEVQEGKVALQGPNAEGGLEVASGKVEGGGMKIHMPKVKVPSVAFSKPTIKTPKLDADASLPEAELKAGDISIAAPDIKLPSVEGSLELQAPQIDLKAPSAEGSLDGAELEAPSLKGKFKMPKFDKPKFGVSPPKAEGLAGEVSLPTAEVDLPSATVTATGEGPSLGLKVDAPGASLKMPKADIKAPKVDISLPTVDVTLPKASVDLQAPEASLALEGEAKAPEKEAAKTKDSKFKMPKFGMPSFGWSSSKEAKATVAADVDVGLTEPQVTVPSGTAKVDVTLPEAELQAPGVEVTMETTAATDGEKGRFKMPDITMPDVKMPSVKLPKVKAPHVQVSLPKAEVSLPKVQAEVQEGKVALHGPDAEGGLEVASGKVEGGGMKIHMPKVKVPSVVFSKPTVKTPKPDADASLPEAELKAGDISIAAPDIKLPSVEGSLDGAELEAPSLKGKFKMPKFDKPKFGVSPPKAEGLAGEVSLPTAEVDLPSATVTATGEGPSLGLKVDAPGASLKMPKADIKAPKVDISLPSVDVTLPKASVDLQAPEASLALEGEAKGPEKEAAKTKDGKFKMPKFGMPSFGWSSSKEAKATVAADVDVGLTEPQVTVPSGTAKVDMTLPEAEIQAPGVEVTMETTAATDGEKGRFKMPDVKMPSVKLPKVKAPHVQVSLTKAEVSLPKVQAEVQEGKVALQGPNAEGGLEVASGKVEGGGMKIHMPKVKVPSVAFSKPTVKTPKLDADASLPEAELKAGDISIAAPDIKLPSVEGSLELQAPQIDLKVPSAEGSLDGAELEAPSLKGKFKMPKFDKPKFGVSPPKAEGLAGEISLPTAEVDLPSATVTATGEGPTLGLKVDTPGTSLKMPKADIKAPKVDISLPSIDVTLPKASVDLQAPEASLALEGEAKGPEKEAAKTKDGKFKMPKFGMPSFGWSSSKEAKATVAAEVDVGLTEPQVTVPSGTAKVDVTLPAAELQAPGVEVTMETTAATDGEKGRFKMPDITMPDVKMPSVKLPKVKAPHVQVSLPKAEVSLPKVQAEVQEGKVALQGPDAEGGLEVASGKVEGGGMKIHMPKVKVPSVVFSKPTVKTPKLDADASLPEAELKAGDISIAAPDIKLPSVEGSLELQAPQIDLKVPSAEGSLDGAELEAPSLKGKFKMPKFDKPKFGVSLPKAEGLAGEVSLPTAEVDLPSATVMATGEGPTLGLKVDAPGASLKMPKADIKAPKVDISLPSVDVTLPKASVDLQAPEASLALEGEAKGPEKEAAKTKDGKFKMPKFGMPSFGWSSSKEAKATVAADVDVGLTEPQVTVPSGTAKVDMTLPEAEIQAPGMEVTMETTAATDGEKGRFKMPDVKMPSVKLPKVKAPHVQVSLTKAEVSLPKVQAEVQEGKVALQGPNAEGGLEVASGKVEGGGMKIHMPKVKVPSVAFSKPTIKTPKLDADASLPEAELKAGDISIAAPDIKLPSVEGSLELQAPQIDLKAPSAEGSLDGAELEAPSLKGKFKMPKFDKPKFGVSLPKAEGLAGEVSLPTAEVDLPSATVTATGEGPTLGLKVDAPGASLKMPKADIKAPKVDISLPSVDVTLPKASVDLQAPEASLALEGEAKGPEKEAAKTKDGKFKMPKFGMPSFGWSSSKEAKATVAADVDVGLTEPQVTVPSGTAKVDMTLPEAEIQAPGMEVTMETTAATDGEKGRFKMPDVKMPSVKLPKVKAPHVQVSLTKAEVSLPKVQAEVQEGKVALQGPNAEGGLEVASGKVEGGGMKIHMPKVKVPSVAFSKPTIKTPKLDADASLPEAELKAGDISIAAPDIKLPSVEGSLELQAPQIDLKAPSAEGSLDGAELEAPSLKGKFKMPKFDKPKFGVSPPKAEGLAGEVSLPTAEVDLPSATVTATGEGPSLGLKVDAPGASLKMPKADIKAPKVDISLPTVDVTLPKASVDLQAPEASLALEGEAKAPEKEAAKTKDSKFKMPKFGMPSFGWSSSKEAKATVAADVDVGLTEPQVTVPSGTAKVDVTLPEAELQAPGVEVTMETTAATDGEKGRFKMPDITMPDVKMPSVKLPKVKAPHVQVSLPKAEVSLPKVQAEVQEGKVALHGPDAEGGLEVASGKVEGGGMKIHMPKVKVPSVVFSKPTVKTPKPDADASLPEAELKAGDISIAAPDIKLPSVEGSLDGAELEAPSLKGKFKMPKFDKPKFGVSPPKAEGLAGEVSLPTAEVDLPSATVTATGEGPSLGLKVDAPGASLKMPKADIKAPKVDISLPSVDVTLPKASVDLQAPEASLALEGEAKGPEKEAAKTKDGKFKMPKFGMPSFGWSSSKEAKATVAADVDVGLTEPQVTVPSGTAKVDMTLPEAEIQAPGVEVTMETTAATDGEKGRFKMPDVKMPSVKLPKVKAPHVQVSLPKAEVSLPKVQAEVQEGKVALQGPNAEGGLEVASGKVEGGGMKIHMPKVKVPSVAFSKPTVKTPKLDADASLPEAELKAGDISIAAPDIKLPSVEGSLELQAPQIDLKVPSAEGSLDGAELEAPSLKGKFKMPKFDKPKFGVSPPKAEGLAGEISLPTAEVDLPSATVTATGEGPTLGLKVDAPGTSLKMPKADIKAPKVDISLPSVDVTLPKASVDLQAPEASLALEGEAKGPEKEAAKTKDGKFKMPKFGMPSFGWSSSKEAKATVAAEVDVGLTEPQVTVPSGTAKVDVTLPAAELQAPGVEVTMETTAATDGEKGRFKMPDITMPDVKMPSVKLPKVKAPHVQVSLPKAEVSLPKVQAEVQEGKVALQGPDAEGGLEVASGKVEGGGMKIHMPKVKVPSVVFSKTTVKTPKLDADASLPEAELKAGDISIAAPDIKLPSAEGSLELQAPQIDLKVSSAEGSLDGAELEAPSLKGKFKMPKFDKLKFGVSPPKAEGLAGEVSLPTAEVDLPSATVTATGEGPSLGLKVDAPSASLKMPKADIKAPKVDISLPTVDVTLPKASVDLQAPEASLALEGEAKGPEKEAAKTKDGKFKMPKFGMPSFGWSSSKEAKATVAAEVDVGLTEPQVTVPSGTAKVDVTLPAAELQAPGVEVTMETTAATDGEKGRFKMPDITMPDVKMPSVKLPKVKAPHVQVSLPKAEVSLPKVQAEVQEGKVALQGPDAEGGLEVASGKVEGGGMKIHMPKVKVPSVVFSKPTVKTPKLDADASLPEAELKAGDISIAAGDIKLPSVEGSLELQAPQIDLKVPSAEGSLDGAELEAPSLKGKFKMPKFDKPKFGVSPPKAEGLAGEVSLPTAEVDLPSATVTATGEGPTLGLKVDAPGASLKMPKADIKAPKVDISLPSVDVTLPKASVDLQAPEASLALEGEAKGPEKEAAKTKDGKFKMPKFGMPSFGWSSSKEAKATVAADVDVGLTEPQVTVPSGTAKVDVTLPTAEIQATGFDAVIDSSPGKGDEIRKVKSSVFRMPKVSLSKSSKPLASSKSGVQVSVSENLCYSLTGEAPAVPSASVESKHLPDNTGDSGSKSTKFRIPSLGFSNVDIGSAKIEQYSPVPKGDITLTKYQMNLAESESKISSRGDESLSGSDFEILSQDSSLEKATLKPELKTPGAEISVGDAEYTVKFPKFQKPKFGISLSKREPSESDAGSKVESEISKGRKTFDMTVADTEKPTQIPDAKLSVKMHKPSPEVVLDVSRPEMEFTMPKLEVEVHGPDLECKAEQEIVSGEKDTEEKEKKLKTSKFKLPSFSWSPKKEAIAPSEVEEHLEESTLPTLCGDIESELTFPTLENQDLQVPFDTSTEKDSEKGTNKKSQFIMPKISFPKMKGQKVQVSLPIVETDVSGPKEEKDVSVQKSEKGSSGEGAGMDIKMPKVTVPTLELSKPEVKGPKIDMDISMPTGEVILPTCEDDDLTLKLAVADASLSTSDVKMISEDSFEVKGPDTSVERTRSEIAVSDVEIKIEGPEGKTKMSKFQMPKFGITHSKGKGSEKEVRQFKPEVKVPQLKGMVEIADIAVEAPDLEVECTGTETYSPKVKMTKADSKASEADVHLPSTDISIPKPDSDIQDSDAALKVKVEIKQDGDGEEKEGHFKMPKFKLPSFSWSPKKEASVKPDSGADFEDHKPAIMSGRTDTEVRGTATDDQGTGPALDLEISAGKVEQKSPIKKPQFVMPKISLSKIKVPKSQTHSPKVEVDATIPKTERTGDGSIQIPDIERSHSERTEEGSQISIKPADVEIPTLEVSRIETGSSKTDMGVSSAKIDAALPPLEGSFQQVVLKTSSTDEDTIQKTAIKFPKGEVSVELRSPEIVTEGSSAVDGRKMRLEGPEGKIKMPKFQKPKFGISLTKGKSPGTEISSPKLEADLPQLKMTNEIADIAVGVPALGFTSDMSDPGLDVYASKIKTPQVLTAGIEAPKVDLSPQSVSKSGTEVAVESLEEKEIKFKKEHEIKAEDIQTEEHQGWFKMPKFRIPAFGRTSSKEKKGDGDIERSMEKTQAGIPSVKVQTETSIPENTFSLLHSVAEMTIGKEGISKSGDSVKSSDVSLPKMEGDTSLSTEGTDSRVNIQKIETYADIVKHGAEGQQTHTSEFTVSSAELSKSYLSASETDKDSSLTNRFPKHTLTLEQHKVKSQDIESSTKLETSGVGCKPSLAEITLEATQEKIDFSLPKKELDIQNQEAETKKANIKEEIKIIGKDSQGSQLKRPACERSTTKRSEDGTYVTAKLEDLKVEVPGVKMDVKIARVDPEMKFQVKSVEKDVSAAVEVQVEDRAETSKIQTYKFKIPKFEVLHSQVKGFEDDINLPKSESEFGTAEMQLQKSEGSIGLKSPAPDHMEASARITVETVDKSQGGPEVNIKIPKLKIPRFTFKALPTEADVSVSKVVTDPKRSSTDIEIVQLQASSAIPGETPEALEGGIQKAKSKILTLTEPDIKTAQMTTTIESSLSNAGQDIHWSYIEGQEVSEKVEPEHVAIERCEIYTTEILKESEILSPEVKTATLGFSLLKVKLPESHSNLEVLVQQPSSTEDVSVSKPKCADESFRAAAQRTGSAELKLSDKPQSETEESSGEVSLPKLKAFAVEVKPSIKPEESHPDKSPEGITADPLYKDEDIAEALEDEEKDIMNEKEKTDSKRSPGRFKFWLPSIGFSSSGDEISTDSKTEVKKSVPEDVKPADASDNDSSKQTEKTGWFRFPKLGFTSPSKKAKTVDKEETGHKEGRISDEDSPSDKPDVFFDAQESLSPKEKTEGEKVEIDGVSSDVPVSRTIVTSSARTELILLEEEKDSQPNIPGDTTK